VIQTNDRQFVNPTDPQSVAKANAVIAQLLNQNLCDSMQKGFNGEIFRITQKGYDVADWLKNIE
jgi:hypothetical protein